MKEATKAVDLNKYKVWILDFDGTLYYQFPVRVVMGCWLVLYYLLHPFRIKELLLILEYRKIRNNLPGIEFQDDYPSDYFIKILCKKYHKEPNDVINIVKSWTETKPCNFIYKFQRNRLIKTIKEYQSKGVLMVVYSDNPLQKKIKAVSFIPDYCFDSDHPFIRCMKPNAKGLNNIIKFFGKRGNKPEDILFIGDRDDLDGICAKNAGIKFCNANYF